jgi:hypothetical protein
MGDFGIKYGEWCVVSWETMSSEFFFVPQCRFLNSRFLIHNVTVEA